MLRDEVTEACKNCSQEFTHNRHYGGHLCGDCRRELKQDVYLPTPDEIAEACVEIRKAWTSDEYVVRHMKPSAPQSVFRNALDG